MCSKFINIIISQLNLNFQGPVNTNTNIYSMSLHVPSRQNKISHSYKYISRIIEQGKHKLFFFPETTPARQFGIMNNKVAKYLSKASLKIHQITYLNINSCNLGDQSFIMISQGNWSNLQKLGLCRNHLTIKIFNFLKKGNWKQLLQIDLSNNNFNGENGQILAQCIWKKLKKLQIAYNLLGWHFFNDIKLNQWENLIFVNLKSTNIGNGTLSVIVHMPWANLQNLNLQSNCITSQGMRALSKGYWDKLKVLNLQYNFINILGVQSLARGNWRNLQQINFENEYIPEKENDLDVKFSSNAPKQRELIKFNSNCLNQQFLSQLKQLNICKDLTQKIQLIKA